MKQRPIRTRRLLGGWVTYRIDLPTWKRSGEGPAEMVDTIIREARRREREAK